MKKRLLALLLLAVLGFSLAACDNRSLDSDTETNSVQQSTNSVTSENSDTDSSSDSASQTDSQQTDTTASTDTTSISDVVVGDAPEGVPVYDPNLEHKAILTDVKRGSIVVLDLNNCNGDWKNLDWMKSGSKARTWQMYVGDSGICGVKYRYSSHYDKDVILVTSSGGRAFAVDYENRKILWDVRDRKDSEQEISLYNAHSIEMLPNGDIIVASSGYAENGANYGNGGLHYYPAGSTVRSTFLSLPFAHAVLWDPSNECLWAIGFEGIVAVKVTGEGENATLTKIPEKSLKKENFTGHDMVPAFGMDGKFWVSDNTTLYLYDSATNTMSRSQQYSCGGIKGIAYFEDGTMILTPATSGWYAQKFVFYVTKAEYNYKPGRQQISLTNGVYKIHTMTKAYE